jgi:hypothetical protein
MLLPGQTWYDTRVCVVVLLRPLGTMFVTQCMPTAQPMFTTTVYSYFYMYLIEHFSDYFFSCFLCFTLFHGFVCFGPSDLVVPLNCAS